MKGHVMATRSIPAVAYYRMSTAQQADSIPEQRAWAPKAATANGAEIVREFQDDGIAGDVGDRPGLMALLSYCEGHPGDIGAVIVWDGDRLSRADSIKTAVVLDRLISAGVTRLLTQEGWTDFDSDLDRLLYNIRQDMGRLAYSKSLSKNVARSGLRRAREGRWVCGKPPYGYVVGPDGHLSIGDPQKAEAVRWLFRHYAGTAASLGDLCRKLAETGVPPPRSGHWTRDTVRAILRNRTYTGDLVWNVNTRGKYSRLSGGEVAAAGRAGKRTKAARPNEPTDYVIVPESHPPLVDGETFEAVGRKLAANFRRRTTPLAGHENPWVLTGLLHCAECGSRMIGWRDRNRQHGRVYTYTTYKCHTSNRYGAGCPTNRVHQEAVLAEVAGLIRHSFTDPERLEAMRAEVEALARQQADAGTAERDMLRDRIAELDRQLDRGAERLLLCPPEIQARAAAKLKEWQAEREQAARDLSRLESAATAGRAFAERVAEALYSLQNLEECIAEAPADVARDILCGLVGKVTLHFRHGRALKCGRRRTTLKAVEVELLSDVAELLGTPKSIKSLVGDWKKYPIGNLSFEQLDRPMKR
jgi:site-specific DNA recombinase